MVEEKHWIERWDVKHNHDIHVLTCLAEGHTRIVKKRQDVLMSRYVIVTTVYCLVCKRWLASWKDTLPQYTMVEYFETAHG